MNSFVRKVAIGGAVALLALGAIAFAVADYDSSDNGGPAIAENEENEATPVATAEPSDSDEATPTPEAAVSPDLAEPNDAEIAGDAGTTTALNPAGHCVALPNTSDVIQHPEKHTKWTITDCEPSDEEIPDLEEPDEGAGDDDGGNGPVEKLPAMNPAGKCKSLPVTSDIVRHPEKHPGWVLGDCGEPEED